MKRGHTCNNLESYEDFTRNVPSHMISFLFGCHISFCYFFALEVVRGHDFWPDLKMCPERSDLLPLICNNGTISGELGS